jgi:hypothetical protein
MSWREGTTVGCHEMSVADVVVTGELWTRPARMRDLDSEAKASTPRGYDSQ